MKYNYYQMAGLKCLMKISENDNTKVGLTPSSLSRLALCLLPVELRQILEAHHFDDLRLDAIAMGYGVPVAVIENLYDHALKRLGQIIDGRVHPWQPWKPFCDMVEQGCSGKALRFPPLEPANVSDPESVTFYLRKRLNV